MKILSLSLLVLQIVVSSQLGVISSKAVEEGLFFIWCGKGVFTIRLTWQEHMETTVDVSDKIGSSHGRDKPHERDMVPFASYSAAQDF